jgi:hypothetical protein
MLGKEEDDVSQRDGGNQPGEDGRDFPETEEQVRAVIQEIEIEFFGIKRIEYAVGQTIEIDTAADNIHELGIEAPPEDLTLERLPMDPEVRQAAILTRLAGLSFREKLQYALFGTREIRANVGAGFKSSNTGSRFIVGFQHPAEVA